MTNQKETFPMGDVARAAAGNLFIGPEGLTPARHQGWVPRLPDHTDQAAGWVREAVAVWGSVAEESLAEQLPERAQPLIPRSLLAVPFGAVGATVITRLLAERINQESALQAYPFRPIVAMGCSYFRGGLRPDTVERFLRSCPGLGGVIVDAVFEYGWESDVVQRGVNLLLEGLAGLPHESILQEFEQQELEETADRFVVAWHSALPSLVKAARAAIRYVPTDLPGMQIREEIDVSIFDGVAQFVDEATDGLGMAFSAALHSLGLPPGFAGAGRVLLEFEGTRTEEVVMAVFPGLPECLSDTLRLVNQEVLEEAAEAWKGWDEIQEDYIACAEWVHRKGIDLTEDAASMTHRRATRKTAVAVMNRKDPGEDLRVAARVRRFLG